MDAQHRHTDDPELLRRKMIATTALIGIVATVAVITVPSVRFAYASPYFHVALETAAGLTAALAAWLFYGRLRHNRLQSNWALVYALALSAAVNLILSVLPAVVPAISSAAFSMWASMGGRAIATAAFVFAAFAPARWVTKGERIGVNILGAVVLTLGIVVVAMAFALPALPPGEATVPDGAPAHVPLLDAHPSLSAIHLGSMLMFTIAAFGFIRRSEKTRDRLMRWLAAAALLGAFSRLHYALYPSLYSEWVYSGDFFRLGFYAMLLVGAVTEIRDYWEHMARSAAIEERRRLARDLHDGLAQELAYIATESRWLRDNTEHVHTVRHVQAAADRALDESRRAIAALTRSDDEPLSVALAQAAEEIGDRLGTSVRLHLDESADVDADTREALLRIAREAISNAGRHSGADAIDVSLSANGHVRLCVSDDGVGFDPSRVDTDRYGLVSMRERARALGAEFDIQSSPGRGTSVEIALR